MARWLPLTAPLVCIGLVLLTACTTDVPPTTGEPGTPATSPFLSVREGPDYFSYEAFVSGPVEVNKADCVTVGGRVISAPHGSTVWDDGQGISLVGIGDFAIGDQFHGGGGVEYWKELTDTNRQDAERCQVRALTMVFGDR